MLGIPLAAVGLLNPGDRGRRDGGELGVGGHQCAAAAALASDALIAQHQGDCNENAITQLKISGMTCGGCVASVTRVLKAVRACRRVASSLTSGHGDGDVRSGRAPAPMACEPRSRMQVMASSA